uniref:UAS domain-containing protein n=1 Tax=Trypanosoma congolense (strain IL3000) TaxID=1068625 RepID=G0UV14_TRYCI|nr:conserved hypothetical protein [Trypanosoma congolense IL3000]
MLSIANYIKEHCNLLSIVTDGGLEEAQNKAQELATYLMIYLHCPTHENTHRFLDEVLPTPPLCELINTRFVFYAASVMEPEGHRLAIEMGATTFPFLAVRLQRNTVMTMKGLASAGELFKNLNGMFDRWDLVLAEEINLKHEREERKRAQDEEERRLVEMQAIDRERMRKYEERVNQLRQQAISQLMDSEGAQRLREEASEAEERIRHEGAFRQARSSVISAEARRRLPQEPHEDSKAETVAFIKLRSLKGAHAERRFHYSDPLYSLRDYAMTMEDTMAASFSWSLATHPAYST